MKKEIESHNLPVTKKNLEMEEQMLTEKEKAEKFWWGELPQKIEREYDTGEKVTTKFEYEKGRKSKETINKAYLCGGHYKSETIYFYDKQSGKIIKEEIVEKGERRVENYGKDRSQKPELKQRTDVKVVTNYKYDDQNRIIEEIFKKAISSKNFDIDEGHLLSKYPQDWHYMIKYSYENNKSQNPVEVDKDGYVTRYKYDEKGRPTEENYFTRDAVGENKWQDTKYYEYKEDDQGYIIEKNIKQGLKTTKIEYNYDNNGLLERESYLETDDSKSEFNGEKEYRSVTTYEYDEKKRLIDEYEKTTRITYVNRGRYGGYDASSDLAWELVEDEEKDESGKEYKYNDAKKTVEIKPYEMMTTGHVEDDKGRIAYYKSSKVYNDNEKEIISY